MIDRDGPRPDLAAMLHPLLRSLIAAEEPVLAEHGITMWAYAVLGALLDHPMRSQAALAEAIGADKTRIISTLDELQKKGYIERWPDPADRRARVLSITGTGRRIHRAVRADIRAKEEWLLRMLPDADRRGFLKALETLSALDRDEWLDH